MMRAHYEQERQQMDSEQDQNTIIIAVPFDAVDDLENQGLACPLPVLRGAGIQALVSLGMDSAAFVTLLQAPEAIRAFAAWIRARCTRANTTIDISVKQGDRRIHLTADGNIDIGIVAAFLEAAFATQRDSNP
jgi:hypothetical protein